MNPGPAGPQQLEEIITRLINVSVAIAFIALVVVLVWAGIKYLTSGGEQKALESAHRTVTWGFLGIVFLALAWLVLKLIEGFTGIHVATGFCVGFPGLPTSCP